MFDGRFVGVEYLAAKAFFFGVFFFVEVTIGNGQSRLRANEDTINETRNSLANKQTRLVFSVLCVFGRLCGSAMSAV